MLSGGNGIKGIEVINGGILKEVKLGKCQRITVQVSYSDILPLVIDLISGNCSLYDLGLITVLGGLLETSVHKGITKRAVLGRDTVSITGVFRFDSSESTFTSENRISILSQLSFWLCVIMTERTAWGCGYRNALMALSSLLIHSPSLSRLFSRSTNGSDPGVRRLQGWLDEAWAKDFDPPGKKHFKGGVLGGRSWVGTGDLYAMFSYKGVP